MNDTATTEIYTRALHDALPILAQLGERCVRNAKVAGSNPVVSMIEKALKTLVFPLFSRLFCVFKISSGTKYSVIGTNFSVQGSHERSHGLSV